MKRRRRRKTLADCKCLRRESLHAATAASAMHPEAIGLPRRQHSGHRGGPVDPSCRPGHAVLPEGPIRRAAGIVAGIDSHQYPCGPAETSRGIGDPSKEALSAAARALRVSPHRPGNRSSGHAARNDPLGQPACFPRDLETASGFRRRRPGQGGFEVAAPRQPSKDDAREGSRSIEAIDHFHPNNRAVNGLVLSYIERRRQGGRPNGLRCLAMLGSG